jgi:uncharacterized protein (TIGR02466 family)
MGKKNKGKKVPGISVFNDPKKFTEEAKFHLLQPFGPAVGMVKMPKAITQKLLELTDKILSDKDRVDWGKNLVGQINEEPWVSNEALEEAGLMEPLRTCVYQYVTASLQRQGIMDDLEQVGVHLDHMWAVSQYENEYNPVHFHTYCDVSCVMYLKIPDFKNRMKEGELPAYKTNKDGFIELIYKAADTNGQERGTMLVTPEEGMLLLFPSNLLHTVYPFKGDEERRSVAFNCHWSAIKKNGAAFDKSVRFPSDQKNEKYLETLDKKNEVSRYAVEDNK